VIVALNGSLSDSKRVRQSHLARERFDPPRGLCYPNIGGLAERPAAIAEEIEPARRADFGLASSQRLRRVRG
jgi:hypothetical protein